jgi:hypothetical protein
MCTLLQTAILLTGLSPITTCNPLVIALLTAVLSLCILLVKKHMNTAITITIVVLSGYFIVSSCLVGGLVLFIPAGLLSLQITVLLAGKFITYYSALLSSNSQTSTLSQNGEFSSKFEIVNFKLQDVVEPSFQH